MVRSVPSRASTVADAVAGSTTNHNVPPSARRAAARITPAEHTPTTIARRPGDPPSTVSGGRAQVAGVRQYDGGSTPGSEIAQ